MLEILSDIGYVFTFIVWPQVAVLGIFFIVFTKSNATSLGVRLLISVLGLAKFLHQRYRGF